MGKFMEFCDGLNSYAHFIVFYQKAFSYVNEKVKPSCQFSILHSSKTVVGVGLLFAALIACSWAYLINFPAVRPLGATYNVQEGKALIKGCNVFEGRWIPDRRNPLYNASQCPFAEDGFDCLSNGRRDDNYLKWRWKPRECEIPKFKADEVLKTLRGKRIVFVGDSLGRSQWESLICMLMTGVMDKSTVYEVNGNQISKKISFLSVVFKSVNLRIDFYRSVFLVQPSQVPRRSPKRVKSTLSIDKMDEISHEWIDSDVLIFNTGHWWTPSKLFQLGCYFKLNGSLKLGMPINTAYRIALQTWASWADSYIQQRKTRVFFRTFGASHWSGKTHQTCKVTRHPLAKARDRGRNSFSDLIIRVTKKMKLPVTVLHVTPMAATRSDAHVGAWGDNPSNPDCSHWCLPGVPDTWNEILLSQLIFNN